MISYSTGSERYSPQLPYTEDTVSIVLEADYQLRMKDLSIKRGVHSLLKREVVWIHKVKSGSAAHRAGLVKVGWY